MAIQAIQRDELMPLIDEVVTKREQMNENDANMHCAFIKKICVM